MKVYLISTSDNNGKRYKIGHTRREVEDRIREFKTGNSYEFEIIDVFESKWGTKIESKLHRKHKTKQIGGEWFKLDDEDIKSFNDDCRMFHNVFELLLTENTYIIDRGGI